MGRNNPQPEVVKLDVYLPVTQELLDDGAWMRQIVGEAFDRYQHPWAYPDRNPFPIFDPVPWFTRATDAWTEARERIEHCWTVLRYGIPEIEEEW